MPVRSFRFRSVRSISFTRSNYSSTVLCPAAPYCDQGASSSARLYISRVSVARRHRNVIIVAFHYQFPARQDERGEIETQYQNRRDMGYGQRCASVCSSRKAHHDGACYLGDSGVRLRSASASAMINKRRQKIRRARMGHCRRLSLRKSETHGKAWKEMHSTVRDAAAVQAVRGRRDAAQSTRTRRWTDRLYIRTWRQWRWPIISLSETVALGSGCLLLCELLPYRIANASTKTASFFPEGGGWSRSCWRVIERV